MTSISLSTTISGQYTRYLVRACEIHLWTIIKRSRVAYSMQPATSRLLSQSAFRPETRLLAAHQRRCGDPIFHSVWGVSETRIYRTDNDNQPVHSVSGVSGTSFPPVRQDQHTCTNGRSTPKHHPRQQPRSPYESSRGKRYDSPDTSDSSAVRRYSPPGGDRCTLPSVDARLPTRARHAGNHQLG